MMDEKKRKVIAPIQELLQNPDQIQVNLRQIHTPSISGYPLKILSYLYHTAFGKFFTSHTLSSSNLDLFANRVIPEPPTLTYSPPPPKEDAGGTDNRSTLLSLLTSNQKDKQSDVSNFYAAYKSGRTTPLEVAHAVLTAIEESNRGETPLRAIVACDHKSVLSMAEASTERWRSGSQLSLLDGIPVSIKEDLCVDTYPCYCGATFVPEFAKNLPESNVVRRLRDAGVVIIGVTNMPVFGCNSIGSSENLIHKQPRNPHNTDFFPGGSSSGAGVSVAAGLCPISLATDGGGSGRVPAAVCGVFCLKPTQGLLHEMGAFNSLFSFSSMTPLTCSPLDIAVFLDVLCNFEPDGDGNKQISAHRLNFNVLSDASTALSGLTVGVTWDWIEKADVETVSVFHSAVEKMKLLGAVMKEVKIPELEEIRVAHIITTVSELSSVMSADVEKHFYEMDPGALLVAALGQQFSATDAINAMKQRTRTIIALKSIFKEVDVIATPTTGVPIPRITPEYLTAYGKVDGKAIGDLDLFTYIANFAGVPAITVPVGVLNEELGLPVGLQLMAPWHQEPRLIQYTMAMEASGYFPLPKPKVCYNVIPN